MEAHQRTFFTRRGIAVRRGAGRAPGRRALTGEHAGFDEFDLLSGAMHYWRLDRNDWPACLAAMRELGLRVVETYVPWGVHETGPGKYDWRREYDLAAFLDEIASAGMLAIVRPGPHINAELTYFGFPRRILEDRRILAVSARDTPVWMPAPPRMFPVPSYASLPFRDEVSGWFAAVAGIVAPRMAPDGPVIAVQVDNEAQMFFRLGAYDHDYHPDALAWWNSYSKGKEPPRAWDPAQASRCVQWVAFKEDYVARSLSWMCAALEDAGIRGIARFHNLPPAEPTLVNLPAVAAAIADEVGMDFYHRAQDYEVCRRRALYLAGSAERLPFAPEVGAGGPPWLPPMSAEDQKSITLGLLACGVRALNLYMTVDRERWYGAPISELGEPRPQAAFFHRLLMVLDEVEWTALRRRVPVALISSRADARFAWASSVADPLTPVLGELLGLGPAGGAELALDHDAIMQRRWMSAAERALDMAPVPYDLVDEASSRAHLARYPIIVLPTIRRVDRELWKKLRELAERGTVIVIGPGKPTQDQHGEPLGHDAAMPRGAGMIRPESIDDLAGFAEDLAGLAELGGDLPDEWLAEQEDVDCSLFEDRHGRPRVLFVGNRGNDGVSAEILVPPGTLLGDAFTDEELRADSEGMVEILLEPYQVRMLLVG